MATIAALILCANISVREEVVSMLKKMQRGAKMFFYSLIIVSSISLFLIAVYYAAKFATNSNSSLHELLMK